MGGGGVFYGMWFYTKATSQCTSRVGVANLDTRSVAG